MKRLLVFASTFPRWKNDILPPFVYELSKRLTKNFEVHILAPRYPGAKSYEEIEGMKVYRFSYFFKKFEKLAGKGGILPQLKKNKLNYLIMPFFLLGEFIALKKLIKKIKPDIIHAHWIIPQGFITALANKKIPFVVTTHGGDIFGLRGKILAAIKKFTLKNAEKITVVSNAIKEEILTKINPTLKIEVISMGVDSKLFDPKMKDPFIKKKYDIKGPFLLFVGRLVEKKGVKYLIEAMPEIIKKFPKTTLLIIGTGILENKLKNLANKLHLQNNIIFTGAIPNEQLPKYYATADVFIGPSIEAKGGDTEGLGLTFVEAGMSGCVLIGSDIGGISDVIKDGENGFLVKEKDSKDLSKKILTLLENKILRKKLKIDSRKKLVEKFDWEIISKKYRGVLECD